MIFNMVGGASSDSFINHLDSAIASDGTPYNGGQGWKTGYRLNSSGVETVLEGMEVTGFIPVKYGDTVYLHGIGWDINSENAGQYYVFAYDSSFNALSYAIAVNYKKGYDDIPSTASFDGESCLTKFVVDAAFFANIKSGNIANVAYIRVNCESITNDSVIMVV